MEIKFVFAFFSTVLGVMGFAPYIRGIWKKTLKPHIFTWIIWAMTTGTAMAGLLYGDAGIGAIPVVISFCLIIVVIVLSIPNASRNISKSDLTVLLFAILAIFVWWILDSPLYAVLMVSFIDVIGYIPTFRKSYHNPLTEVISSWVFFFLADGMALLALETYNLLTVSYLLSISIANLALLIFLLIRKKRLVKGLNS